jgi:hypothetical protein
MLDGKPDKTANQSDFCSRMDIPVRVIRVSHDDDHWKRPAHVYPGQRGEGVLAETVVRGGVEPPTFRFQD